MINVLWLASWYPNRTDAFTGDFIERHAIAVSRYVRLTVLVITKDALLNYNQVEIEKSSTGNLTVYKVYYGSSRLGGDLEKILSFKKYLQLQKKFYKDIVLEIGAAPAIIHVHVAMKAGMLARWLKKRRSIPFLVTEHWSGYNPESRPNIYEANWLFKQLNKKILQEASLLLPVSNALGQMINRHFVKSSYRVVPNVVDTDRFFYQPSSTATKFRFIHPSSMSYPKNPEGILQACKIVKEKGYDYELLMIGNKDERLVALADQHGLAMHVIFKSAVPYEEVAQQMQASSALLLFSHYENLPCVILEALCCGLPVVSSRVGGIDEVIDDSNGILVERENVADLASAMIDIMENNHRYKREDIATKAQELYNYDTIARQYHAIYQQHL